MKKLLAMAVPILPGKTAQWKKFSDELTGKRFHEYSESRKRLNVHERVFLQTTSMGDFAIVTLEGEDPQNAFRNFSTGNDDFTQWFVSHVKEIHGIDLKDFSKEAFPELFIDSEEVVLQH